MEGREYVIPDDVKRLVRPVMSHRIRLRAEYETEEVTAEDVIKRALEEVEVPKA